MELWREGVDVGGWSWGERAWMWEGGAGKGGRGGGRVELGREGVEGCGSTDELIDS